MTTRGESGRFAELLRQYRVIAGLSQEELAERAGLSRRGITDLERGARRLPHPETVRRLAGGLGLEPIDQALLSASARPMAVTPLLNEPSLLPLPVPPTSFIGRD